MKARIRGRKAGKKVLVKRADQKRYERNKPCLCGSGRKAKVCCGHAQDLAKQRKLALVNLGAAEIDRSKVEGWS